MILIQHDRSAPDPGTAATSTVPYHSDNGLFLILTPVAKRQQSLLVKDADGGNPLLASSEQGDVIIVFGRALDEWLFQTRESEKQQLFRAGIHSVPEITGAEERVVFARMYVAPETAIPVQNK